MHFEKKKKIAYRKHTYTDLAKKEDKMPVSNSG